MTRIVGSILVRNEDVFVGRAVLNILDFCDEILVQDHQSADRTREILDDLARRFSKIKVETVSHPHASSVAIEHLADTPAWIFGVDGDEIYDPAGLARMRRELLSGMYDDWWAVFGNVLHCTSVDMAAARATGYLTPPSKSMTKLYNYRMLRRVDPKARLRLAGRNDIFHDPAMRLRRLNLHERHPWEEGWFRCLHTCFVPRSTLDEPCATARDNVSDNFNWLRRWKNRVRRVLGLSAETPYKLEKYRRGEPVTLHVPEFFPEMRNS
jgi:glycosyltransferase involved in cell wall biosynthesis